MRRLGWVLFAATCALFVLQGVFLAASDYPLLSYEVLADEVFPLLGLGSVIGAGVGALIVSRYPHNIVGWLLVVGQFGNMIGIAADAYLILVGQGVVQTTMSGTIEFVQALFDATFSVSCVSVLFMIAPDGTLLSRRWRFAVGLAIAALALRVLVLVGQFIIGLPLGSVFTGSVLLDVFFFASYILLLVSLLLGAVALLIRLARCTGQRRLQLRWIAWSATVFAVTFVAFATGPFWAGTLTLLPWLLPTATCLAYIFFTVSVGVAILRHRLFDIDVILSRTIALGVLAVFVTVGYIAVVVAIGAVLSAIGTPGSSLYWPSLIATALVAVAFQPLRRHVLRLADQLVYGSRAAPYEALAELSRRLADSPSPEALPVRLADATGRAVGADRVCVRVGTPNGPTVHTASWPSADADARTGGTTVLLPVRDMGEQIGTIEVAMPPGRPLRIFERDLLEDVAAQAGVACRNALLETQLAAKVAEGESTSAALAASRRRLVGVEDEARERLSAAIRRSVVPHLAAVGTGIDGALTIAVNGGHSAALDDRLPALIEHTQHALDELRQVCRGVFPALLERRGLVPALVAQLDDTHPQARLDVEVSAQRRFDRAAETAAYVFCTEMAPTDRPSVIGLRVHDDRLHADVTCSDWDVSPQILAAPEVLAAPDVPAAEPGTPVPAGWQHAGDRVAAADGDITFRTQGDSLSVTAVIPIAGQPDREPAMAAQTSSSRSGPKTAFGT